MKFILDFFIKFLGGKDNALVATGVLSFIVTLLLVWITSRYVFLTKKISETNLKVFNLNEETEKRNLTLNIIYGIDRNRLSKLQEDLFKLYQEKNIELENLEDSRIMHFKDRSQSKIPLTPDMIKEVNFFINYFDTISILYLNKKLDEDLFKKKILDSYFISFIINFSETIVQQLNIQKKYTDKIINWQQNFLTLSIQLLNEYNKVNLDIEIKEIFNYACSSFEELLPKNS